MGNLTPKTDVSVIIPTYNEEFFLSNVLASLNDQVYRNFEVIVVDNVSTDGTIKIAQNFQKNVNYPLFVISELNPGVAYARKRGGDEVLLRLMKRDDNLHHLLVVTDADTILPRDWLNKIIKGFKQNNVGGLAGTHEASQGVEKRIEKKLGIKNYFNIAPLLIEFLEKNGLGEIKMSGPNSVFSSTSYASGGGFLQEYDKNGKLQLGEVGRLGKRIRSVGYAVVPMRCRVIKNRRRELFEIINDGKNSYFPQKWLQNGRFNVIRTDETKLLDLAIERVHKKNWVKYRHRMLFTIINNFIAQPLVSGKITKEKIQKTLSPQDANILLNTPNFERSPLMISEKFLNSLETMLYKHE